MSASGGFGSWLHLAHRFFGALSPAGPPATDEAWAEAALLPGERRLWERMSGPDRRHAIGVAREASRLLGAGPPPRAVLAAALLHDVGKVESSLGTFSRVAATLLAMVLGRERTTSWRPADATTRPSWRARVALYLEHDRLGSDLLERAGSDELTSAWARQHHLPEARWTVDPTVAAALKRADGD
jgi:hypothetical protein